ncbi:MAG: 2-hydroxyacyl-CoA dehydratase subunit D [Candidatus Heimdallarchaeota archaeon]
MNPSHLLSNEAQVFRDALENPVRTYERIQTENNKPIIGYFTDVVPVELLHAAGGHPGRLFPSSESDEPLDSLVQTFCCSYLRNFLSYALETDLKKAVSAVVFTNNFCDSLTNVMDIFEHAFPEFPFTVLNQPVAATNSNVEVFFQKELQLLSENLAKITGQLPDDKTIRESITTYEQIRTAQSKLEMAYYEHHDQIAFSDFVACLSGREFMPAGEYKEVLNVILSKLEKPSEANGSDSSQLILVGGMFHDLQIFDVIEQAGSSVVGELLLFGRKDFDMKFSKSKSALESLAKSYLAKLPSATRYDLSSKTNSLLKMVEDKQADGVVHLNWKFCDPDAFEAVMVKNALEKAQIPFLMLETDPQRSNIEQMKTRCQAFCEMLEEK